MKNPIFKVEGLVVGYGGNPVLNGIDLDLHANEVLCLIGHNGAGKSTLLKALFGLVRYDTGKIFLDGEPLAVPDPKGLTMAGISLVPEGKGIFSNLTVQEIMAMGMWAASVPRKNYEDRLEWVIKILPAIGSFYKRRANTLSGGQQQMVSIGRALLSRPRCLLMDEPSIGLAPKLFHDLLIPIRELQLELGLSILLVEQNVKEAFKISDRVVALKSGSIIRTATPAELADNKALIELF